ncbi:hypothetical protein SELMODRAFT_81712 [Selaginella moellendorffii]|uniref:Pentacotripeptide-repeat region of PRORP domain-containing protein n=2 Tax=Selaginella moellendorffii TaxID=88036 RepID=D8R0Q6_SELML|nr:hypothetical protein SELMODRAFT_81712 [Selaginella moellendorffii]
MPESNGVSWSAIVSCYAQTGRGESGVRMFAAMAAEGFPADQVACLSGLVAQTHIGRVPQCCAFFRSMQQDFGVAPLAEHLHGGLAGKGRASAAGGSMQTSGGPAARPGISSPWTLEIPDLTCCCPTCVLIQVYCPIFPRL